MQLWSFNRYHAQQIISAYQPNNKNHSPGRSKNHSNKISAYRYKGSPHGNPFNYRTGSYQSLRFNNNFPVRATDLHIRSGPYSPLSLSCSFSSLSSQDTWLCRLYPYIRRDQSRKQAHRYRYLHLIHKDSCLYHWHP